MKVIRKKEIEETFEIETPCYFKRGDDVTMYYEKDGQVKINQLDIGKESPRLFINFSIGADRDCAEKGEQITHGEWIRYAEQVVDNMLNFIYDQKRELQKENERMGA